ncbi:MAG: DUF2207 domain-containing protein [Armatimonadota bacterium]
MKIVKYLLLLMIAVIACIVPISLAYPQGYSADERIQSYHSDITVNKDSSMLVTETIQVVSTGSQIRHGIYRDFPTRYKGKFFGTKVGFEIKDIKRDGKPEPYHTENQSNGIRIYIGDGSVTLPPGRYTYIITYKTDRQLGYFEDHDELYWNVTGNGWVFPISKASATVTLPQGVPAKSIKVEGYTGPQGSKDQNYTAKVDSKGRAVFATTYKLEANQGLTIVVSWPKGYVDKPTRKDQIIGSIKEDTGTLYGLIGLLLLLVYYVFVWLQVGVDPKKGSIVAQYEPPDGLSPAAVRYIKKMGFDQKGFAANLIDMAVKRYITIDETHGLFTIIRAGAEDLVLSHDEMEIAKGLLKRRSEIELVNSNHQRIGATYKALGSALKDSYQKRYFNTNSIFMIPGIVITILMLVSGVLSHGGEERGLAGFMTVWLSFWTLGVTALVAAVIKGWKGARYGSNRIGNGMSAGCLTLFAIPFFIGEIVGIGVLTYSTSIFFMLTLISAMIINYIFYKALKAPTQEGRALLDRIDGFREYLSVAESDRLGQFAGPAKTPELFERFLPYALALDVEQAWANKFADVLARAGQGPDGYSPAWYTGTSFAALGAGGFAAGLGSSLSGAISSSSTAPGSSSGSGGGGSSGGGGGGGGGGGW